MLMLMLMLMLLPVLQSLRLVRVRLVVW